MSGKVYAVNKGVNKPIEFKGLKAQYIWHLAGVILGMLMLFAVLHIAGVGAFFTLPLVFGLGGWLGSRVYRMSKRYGQYGLMKRSARKAMPKVLLSRSRKCFIKLYHHYVSNTK